MSKPAAAVDVADRILADDVLAFDHVVRKTTPYAHIVSPRFYTETFAETLLGWLESRQDWHLKEGILFEHYELGFSRFTHCKEIEGLWDGAVLARLRDAVTRAYWNSRFEPDQYSRSQASFPGQFANIHTDMIPEETHRLVVQLNRGRADDLGGTLCCSPDPGPQIFQWSLNRTPIRPSALSSARSPFTLWDASRRTRALPSSIPSSQTRRRRENTGISLRRE